MEDHQSMFRDFFIRWNQETYILLRIRVIMGYLLFMYSWMFAMSGYVIRTELRSIVSFLDALSEILFVYILGAMQAAPFKNQLFPVWAICLINLLSSINYLSRYGTYFELRNMFKLLVVPFLIIKHGSKSWCIPLWLFWSLLVVECLYRFLARYLASKSLWHGRSTELLQEYMGSDHSESFNPERCKPETMEGYRYLVYGESKQTRKTGHGLSIDDSRSLITLDKIWQCNGPLLRPINKQKNNMKHLTLAFALSRLLRCRLEGAKLHLDTISMTQKLFRSLICADNAEKVLFGIKRLDLVFLRHYFHISYPMVFCEGLLSFSITFLLFVVKVIMVLWILKDIGTVYHTQLPRPRDSFDILHYFITDLGITQTAMVAIGIMNSMKIYKYVASKWMILLLVCNYVNCGNRCMRYVLGVIIANFPVSPLQRWSEVKIKGHYDFLQSYNRRESKWELVASAIKESWTQRASMKRIDNVKAAVIQALALSMDLKGHPLPRDLPSLRASDRTKEHYRLECLRLPRCCHTILVWHIATSICEMRLAHPVLPSSFLVDEKTLDGNLQKSYTVAKCLSGYCADLLVSKPDLLPEPIMVSKKVLRDTVQHAREMLGHRNSSQSIYNRLMEIAQEAEVPGSQDQDIMLSGNILQQGAKLANELIVNEGEGCWKILAEVWAGLLVHIAPSSSAEAHRKHLESGGGEFVTLIWALLCHCGIENSKMWPDHAAAGGTLLDHLRRNGAADAYPQQTAAAGGTLQDHLRRNGAAAGYPQHTAAARRTPQDHLRRNGAAGAYPQQTTVTSAQRAIRSNGQGGNLEDVQDAEITMSTSPTLGTSR